MGKQTRWIQIYMDGIPVLLRNLPKEILEQMVNEITRHTLSIATEEGCPVDKHDLLEIEWVADQVKKQRDLSKNSYN